MKNIINFFQILIHNAKVQVKYFRMPSFEKILDSILFTTLGLLATCQIALLVLEIVKVCG